WYILFDRLLVAWGKENAPSLMLGAESFRGTTQLDGKSRPLIGPVTGAAALAYIISAGDAPG
ncbi:MAG: hypothetical protein IJ461_08405, partial [Clostridia bacterium]|nr:hypothetical protein [Clostridia bacterium]